MDVMLKCVGFALAAVAIVIIIFTLVDVHRKIGLSTNRGFFWACVVACGSLFGVLLYWYFRQPTENLVEFMIERR